jgi:hypothetical protein
MILRSATAATALGALVAAAPAAIVPFTETFTSDAANWTGPAGPATWDPAGTISADTNVNAASFGVVIGLRGQLANNASTGAFVGDWIAQGVSAFSFSVRHDAPLPMNFGARLVTTTNFPAAIGLDFAPVLPGVWTTVTIPINPGYPGFVSFEGSDFNTIFSNIGSVQLLYSVPGSLAGTGTIVRFEADNVSIVPGAGTMAMLGPIGLMSMHRRRR